MPSTIENNTSKFLGALILAIFAFLVLAQADKKFALDELDFPVVAKATSETGRPVYYRGEATPNHLGLYHPPLYIYALAAQIKIFGFSENTVRGFGLACTLLTAALAASLSRRLVPASDVGIFRLVFLGIFLLNPYTIANATLPDIDSTILPPLITLFILLTFNRKSPYLLASVFAILLWTKLTTPLALIPFCVLYWRSESISIGHAFMRTALVFGGGSLLFLATYWLYCRALSLPFGYTFEFLIHSFTKGSASSGLQALASKVWGNLSYSIDLLITVTAPLVMLFLASFVLQAVLKTRTEQQRNNLFLTGLCLGVTIFYCSLISPFGGFFKYPFAVFQFACLGVSLLIVRCLTEFGENRSYGLIALTALGFFFATLQILLWKDKPAFSLTASSNIIAAFAIGMGILTGLLLSMSRGKIVKAVATIVLTVAATGAGMGIGIARHDALAPYPTKYSRGQLGMDETVAYLRARMNDGEVIWSMKDIGFYSGNHYIENYDFFFTPGANDKAAAMVKAGVRFFVATQGIGEDRIDAYPAARAALENCCKLEKNFGNFYIYTPK